jgi:hypothetical protein
MQKYHAKLFKNLSKLLTRPEFISAYTTDPHHFTRTRKLTFQKVTLIILRLLKSSITNELKSFYTSLFREDEVTNWVSNAAFCKARTKISWTLFVELYRCIVRYFYAHIGGERWFHYRVLAVDGSELNLPSSPELLERFGYHHSNSIGTRIPQARVSFLVDVLNNITVDAQIESFKVSEQQMFVSQLPSISQGDLLTADCNYGHFWLLKHISARKGDFCIRMSHRSGLVQSFLASGKHDMVIQWEPSRKTRENCKKRGVDPSPMTVRLVRIDLSSKKAEVLVTSLCDQTIYTYEHMKELYEKRWAAEEEIKKYMQRLLIEYFSSLKVNGVLQDFYAHVFVLNSVSFLAEPVKAAISRSCHTRSYRQKINWSSAIHDVRSRLIVLFIRSVNKIDTIIRSLWKSFRMNTEVERPGRAYPRDKRKKGSRKKAFIQYKPSF